ncbi:hypothetical protein [Sphingomonas sp. 10B4]|nr:hypothetical protein [Sphingomonas sp. 10B4]MDY7523131.1 hypothetical protein [Sphingomonas sp. 10B4]MEB0284429.1 hypothetical protein [Sphingomonas sp. 10B4]
MIHPHVTNQRSVVENGTTVLTADTTVVLDCRDKAFSRCAREKLEREQVRVSRRFGFGEVRLSQI